MSVSPHYDSMLGKLIAHGATRAEALDRLALALDRTALLGVPSNRAFLARVLRHPAFVDGAAVSTAFIERHFPRGPDRADAPDDATWQLAGVAVGGRRARVRRGRTRGAAQLDQRARAALAVARCAGARRSRSPTGTNSSAAGTCASSPEARRWSRPGRRASCAAHPPPPGSDGHAEVGDIALAYRYAWAGSTLWLHTHSGDFAFDCLRRVPRRNAAELAAQADEVRAAINGRVLEVAVAAGAEVTAGQRLCVLEAMKMEHELRAPKAGRIEAVEIAAGQQVAPGNVLMRYERGA